MGANVVAGAVVMAGEQLVPDVPYVAVGWLFEDVYVAEYPGLLAVAVAMTGDRPDSEDLVQDTMVKAFINWRKLRGFQRPGAWCHMVLVNALRSRWRRRSVERRYASRLWRDDVVAGPSEEIVAFWAAVRELPSRPRAVVAMFYAADRTTAEIAEALKVPEGTVRSDLSRARDVLATKLGV
jgi:RNA polymerase sigma-70 factor (ECF subfamily)